MKTLVFHPVFLALIGLILSPLAVAYAAPFPADSVHFCQVLDFEQWERDRPRPAAKRLVNLNVGEPRTVRLIYFLPNDREPQQDIDAKLDALIKDVQQYYAEQMENHGFGRKTFNIETDATGKAVVHHVNGRSAEFYDFNTVRSELEERFDLSKNVYLVLMEQSGGGVGGVFNNGRGGMALLGTGVFVVPTAAHELGHAFGLLHDWRNDIESIPTSYIFNDLMLTSFCTAEWLDVHPYFNTSQTTSNQNTNIQAPSLSLASPPYDIRLRFEVTDPDGLHQAQLLTEFEFGTYKKSQTYVFKESGLIAWNKLNDKSATVEFVTNLLPKGTGNRVQLRIMDVNGNFTARTFPINITALLPPPEAVAVPDPNLAMALRARLVLTPGETITQLDMLRLWLFEPIFGKNISDFTGLEHATNLRIIALRGHPTRDIRPLVSTIAGLTNLRELRFGLNQISDLSSLTELADLPHLRELRLNGNQISNISPLAALTNLHMLWLNFNQISDVSPLAGLTNLYELRLTGNSIADTSPLLELLRQNPNLKIDIDVGYVPPSTETDDQQGGDPHTLEKVSGDGQGGLVGVALAEPFVVSVLDEDGAAIAGTVVSFSVTAGGGTLSAATVTTDANGRARSTLTLGSEPGTNTVAATVEGLGTETFTAIGQATADPDGDDEEADDEQAMSQSLTKVSGEGQAGQAGTTLAEPFVVSVLDQNGSAYAGAVVTFSVTAGGGTLSATTATTNASGQVRSTLTLGSDPGPNTVSATVAGLEPVAFTATATAIEQTPHSLTKVSGEGQAGQAGATLAEPFVVSVLDEDGAAIAGAVVTFSVTAGGGMLSSTTATTDANGRARSTLTLGSQPGTNTVTATVAELESVTFTASGYAIPHSLTKVSGEGQEGAASTQLAEPFVVSVLDEDGAAIAGAAVTFSVTAGGGTLSSTTATTDANGRARSTLTLGSQPGLNAVAATVAGLEPVTFTASGYATPHSLTKVSGEGQEGPASTQLAEPFVVSVLDQDGAAIAGASVTFSVTAGEGVLSSTTDANPCIVESSTSSATATTDANGRAATRLTLGSEPGSNTVAATVEGLEPVTFTATAAEQAMPHSLTKVCGEDQEGTAGILLDRSFVVSVSDEDDAAAGRSGRHLLGDRWRGDAVVGHGHYRCQRPRRDSADAGQRARDEYG